MNRFANTLGIARSLLMYYGTPWRTRRLLRFYGQFIQPGDLCFDIGAHVGNRMRLWHRLGGRIVGVEPQPQLMRLLLYSYGRFSNITLIEQAIGAEPGEATLYVSERTPTVTSLSERWITAVSQDPTFAHVQWNQQITVPVTTLDALIAEFGLPAFCKIDVEGYELEVLRGLSQPLPALSFEYVAATMPLALACVDRLTELGNYEFNWSEGEQHRWQTAVWLPPADLKQRLQAVQRGSGDIYARRIQ
ncbi:MAG: FkbM family methyltransferase [Ardenticatenaceae bacterium]|nr:FkbM family methyltransferase [Ardenticatenaceae bacterium]